MQNLTHSISERLFDAGSVRLRFSLRHPGLAKPFIGPFLTIKDAGIVLLGSRVVRLQRCDCAGSPVGRQGKVMLQRVLRLRFMTGQSQRSGESLIWPRVARPGRDRLARPVDRLIVLLHAEIGPRFPVIHILQLWTARAEQNRLVKYFQALFVSTEADVIPAHAHHGVQVGRVQGKRPFPLRNSLLKAPLVVENPGL